MSEFAIIQEYFSTIQQLDNPAVALGIGDDAAILNIPKGQQLVVSTDTMNIGRHFPENAPAEAIAYRAVATAVSDLAAMAAKPLGFTLSLSLTDVDQHWLQQFSKGLLKASTAFKIPLVGGDTTRGPLSIAVQVMGCVSVGDAVRRSGAQLGDDIYVSNYLGDAALALPLVLGEKSYQQDDAFLSKQFYYPEPQLELGLTLKGIASSMIDISDGLLSDLGHICKLSDCQAQLDENSIPVSPYLTKHLSSKEALTLALTGGDDYQLCFTAAKEQAEQIKAIEKRLATPLSKVGEVVEGSGVYCLDEQGKAIEFKHSGFNHFR